MQMSSIETMTANNEAELRSNVFDAVADAVIQLTFRGSTALRGGDFSSGAPLSWSRYDFAERKKAIQDTRPGYPAPAKPDFSPNGPRAGAPSWR